MCGQATQAGRPEAEAQGLGPGCGPLTEPLQHMALGSGGAERVHGVPHRSTQEACGSEGLGLPRRSSALDTGAGGGQGPEKGSGSW